jgi:hypothetical protein
MNGRDRTIYSGISTMLRGYRPFAVDADGVVSEAVDIIMIIKCIDYRGDLLEVLGSTIALFVDRKVLDEVCSRLEAPLELGTRDHTDFVAGVNFVLEGSHL